MFDSVPKLGRQFSWESECSVPIGLQQPLRARLSFPREGSLSLMRLAPMTGCACRTGSAPAIHIFPGWPAGVCLSESGGPLRIFKGTSPIADRYPEANG